MMKAVMPLVLASVLPGGLFDFLHSECKNYEVMAFSTSKGVELSYYGDALGVQGDEKHIDRMLRKRGVATGHCHVFTAEQYAKEIGDDDIMNRFPAEVLDNRIHGWQPSIGDMEEVLRSLRISKGKIRFYLLDTISGHMVEFRLTPAKEREYRKAGKKKALALEDQLLDEYERIAYGLSKKGFTRPVGDEPSLDKLIERTKGTSFVINDMGIYGK